jgi:hypothetical protein
VVKHLVVIAVLALALPQSASAVPFLKGKIVSSGVSKNNLTTAATFTIPNGPVSVLCDAAVYFVAGASSATAATSDGFPLAANAEKTMTAVNGGNVFAILPVSGTATCKVFQLNGETIAYRGDAGGGNVSTTDAQTALLGQPLSVDKLVITASDNSAASLLLNGGRIQGVSPTVSGGAYFFYDLANYWWQFGHPIYNCGGCQLSTDILISRQGDRPVAVSQSHGLQLSPQSSVGTCGATPGAPEGSEVTLSSASVSGPSRRCYCSRDGGSYTWVNLTCPAVAGTSTSCPACS